MLNSLNHMTKASFSVTNYGGLIHLYMLLSINIGHTVYTLHVDLTVLQLVLHMFILEAFELLGFHSVQAMRFGDLPVWATELANLVREVVHFSDYVSEFVDIAASDDGKNAYLFPSKLLWREPLFDQLIINLYQPGEVRYHFLKF
ncbi:hypothetical protein CsSME_00039974 [Camellia sinensis var. sinensis]